MTITPLNLFVKGTGQSNRSFMTCTWKCGNACDREIENTSSNSYFRDIAQAALSRRGVLRGGGALVLSVGAGSALAACSSGNTSETNTGESSSSSIPAEEEAYEGMRFEPIAPTTEDAVVIPEGYEQSVLIAWGDPIHEGGPEFDINNQNRERQEQQFGFNNDFAGLLPIEGSPNSYLYVCSHEYTTEPNMFPGYTYGKPTDDQIDAGIAAHGATVLEVTADEKTGKLTPKLDSKYNRRITGFTEFELRGPAVGKYTRTSEDPTGTKVMGTFNNCSGGITPWGTQLSGEENVDILFANADKVRDKKVAEWLKRFKFHDGASDRAWEKKHDRFDLAKEPNESNRFGYIVEINPFDPTSTPVKHSALGRFRHEAGQIYVTDDGTVVCYSGDDAKFEYMYKFISTRKMKKGRSAAAVSHNMGILDEGTLYVAKFTGNSPESEITGDGALPSDGHFDGEGTWVPLMTVTSDGKAESHIDGMTGEEVALNTRAAGDKAGATKMDRPEDFEPNPHTGKVYVALTKNSDRGEDDKEKVDEANPRHTNKNGHVIEIDDNHAGEDFRWNILLACGDPNSADTYFGGFDKSKVSPISCPDNVAFDPHGNLWISTDGNALDANDGLYAVALEGERRGEVKQFLSVPVGAETCGPIIDERRVMVNVQHPGETDYEDFAEEGGDPIANPSSHWPGGGDSKPRPAVAVVWKKDGSAIGS